MSSDIHTYTGAWINWSHGRVNGATITMSHQHGGFLLAFLAIFVSFAGGMFWRILSYILHQINATEPTQSRDWLHHQRQVVLRNSGSGPGGAAWAMLMLLFGSKRRSSAPTLRSLPFALLALVCLILFGVAGVFTSTVTKVSGNSTLILGPDCGGYKISTPKGGSVAAGLTSKMLTDTLEASAYEHQCYRNGSNTLACGTFVRSRLPFTAIQNASCPFTLGLCKPGDSAAFSMDTGLLDSHADFGINSSPQNRVQFRRVTTCAPVKGRSFGSIQNGTVFVNAGPALGTNYTFSYSLNASGNGFGYQLRSVFAAASVDVNSQEWNPVPEFNRTDGDVTLISLAQNDVAYLAPSEDPWIPANVSVDSSDPATWVSPATLSLMGCVDQYQICNPVNSKCTKLLGQMNTLLEFGKPGNEYKINLYQERAIVRFLNKARYRTMVSVIEGRGATALNVQEHLYSNTQGPIPPDQWQKEVAIWFATCLAKEQAWAVEWATAPRNIDHSLSSSNPFTLTPPTDDTTRHQCRNQMVRDQGGYQSFSILGVALVLVLGGLIILVGLTVDIIGARLMPRKGRYRTEQWELESNLALHAAAYTAFRPQDDDAVDRFPPSSIIFRGVPDGTRRQREAAGKGGYVAVQRIGRAVR